MNPWIVLVTIGALLVYFSSFPLVTVMRVRHGVKAPAMTGHEMVERALRVQGNTLEWLVIFLPSLWMFYPFWGAYLAVALGVVWIVGRALYAFGYIANVKGRYPGFGLQAIVTFILLIGAAVGAIRALTAG